MQYQNNVVDKKSIDDIIKLGMQPISSTPGFNANYDSVIKTILKKNDL
jgi:hypothetical protein